MNNSRKENTKKFIETTQNIILVFENLSSIEALLSRHSFNVQNPFFFHHLFKFLM